MSAIHSLQDVIFSRRSIRRYDTTRPIPRDVLTHLINAGIWAPSAHNRQPWRFAIIESPEQRRHLAQRMGERLQQDLTADNVPQDVINKDVQRSYERITSAPAIILLCLSMVDMDSYPDERRTGHEKTMAVQSVAMAAQNILLTAHEAGLGTCWMCAPLFCADVVKSALSLPEDWQPQGMITLGYPAQERSKERKPLDDVLLWY
jgi:coenzyme F420-0:L-glutamate ligase/coenzyme F420-1:gamma-L-glutamate ligase